MYPKGTREPGPSQSPLPSISILILGLILKYRIARITGVSSDLRPGSVPWRYGLAWLVINLTLSGPASSEISLMWNDVDWDYLVIKSKWIFDINLEDIFSYNWDCPEDEIDKCFFRNWQLKCSNLNDHILVAGEIGSALYIWSTFTAF